LPRIPDKSRLLRCPYRASALRVCDRADCLLPGVVIITSWTDARISWPRCRRPEGKSHPSLLFDEELARAVRTEAAAAVMFWWGVSGGVVNRWRKFLDVTRTNNGGTHRLVQASAEAGAEVVKAREWTDAERQAMRDTAKRLDLAQHLRHGYHGPRWTAAQLKLPGKLPDLEVARRIGRTVNAVRIKRELLGLPNTETWGWTAVEVALLGTAPDAQVAAKIDRSTSAVMQKRCKLGIPTARDGRR
jgi:hypothetical protein